MKIIGVTGGIGSGKSTVTRILADLGAKVIDADRIAREVVRKGMPALDELTAFFGTEILDENGELDRKKLSDIVFGDQTKLQELNRITHKHIIEKIARLVDKYKTDGNTEIVVIDAPIPVKEGFRDIADQIWTVTADKETRIKRIMSRSSYTREDAERRISSQIRDDAYISIADEIIKNDGTPEELELAVARLYVKTKS